MDAMFAKIGRWVGSTRALALLEIVCLVPAISLLIVEMVAWGGHVWLSHDIQAIADGALAAAASEQNADARETRARVAADHALTTHAAVLPGALHLSVVSDPRRLTVLLIYDASRSPVFVFERLLPLPSPVIARMASQPLDAR